VRLVRYGESLEAIVGDLRFQSGDNVAVMVDGLGGTPIGTLPALRDRSRASGKARHPPSHEYVGEYTLDMAGASLTLVKLDDEVSRLLDAPAEIAMRIF
jgi:dihydroxyacetone kinase-like protein